jgi:hypothetical protein
VAHRALTNGARLFARRARSLAPTALVVSVVLAACGDPPVTKAPTRAAGTDPPSSAAGRPPAYATDDGSWGKFHSKRFQLTVPLPDGRAWKIDDHRSPELVAVHPPTSSRLTILATQEEELMNRQRCEERAKARSWMPKAATLTTVEDQVHVGPDAYDSRVWVAVDAVKEGGGVEGHVYLFGAFLRRCLLVHLSTSVPSARDEEVLASRLVIGSARIVKAITLDPPRTTDDAVIPRDKPEIRR